jgi:hypothetical protein
VDILQSRERTLPEPIWQNPTAAENIMGGKAKIGTGKSKLIRHKNRYALVPKSWLRTNSIDGDEEFSARVQLSSCYEVFDDHFDGVGVVG